MRNQNEKKQLFLLSKSGRGCFLFVKKSLGERRDLIIRLRFEGENPKNKGLWQFDTKNTEFFKRVLRLLRYWHRNCSLFTAKR